MLVFKYGTMNSGKTLELLRMEFDRGNFCKVVVSKPKIDTREGSEECIISSRIGVSKKGIWLEDLDMKTLIDADLLLIDEAQFLSKKVIDSLRDLSHHIDIICYGLSTNFKSEMFEGSKRLFEVADEVIKMDSYCEFCGKEKTVFNVRIDGKTGKVVNDGEEIGIEGAEHKYVSCCSKCKNLINGEGIV